MPKIIVYPTKESALKLSHPTDGALRLSGSSWEQDGFTCRMISDRALTVDPNEAWRAPAPASAAVGVANVADAASATATSAADAKASKGAK